jgi:hypothetical protein
MYLQKVISKKNKKKIFFVDVLKVTDEKNRIKSRIESRIESRIRIRILTKMSGIRDTAFVLLDLAPSPPPPPVGATQSRRKTKGDIREVVTIYFFAGGGVYTV